MGAISDDDAALIARVLAGDGAAFESLVTKYQNKVYRLAWSMTRNEQDAEEVVQDVFLTVHRKLDTFTGAAAFSSWLYRVTANAAMMKLRTRKRTATVSLEDVEPVLDMEEHTPGRVQWAHRPDEELQSKEALDQMRQAIAQLAPGYRSVLVLRDIEGYTSAEVAEMLDITVSAVKSRLHRGRMFVRNILHEFYTTTVKDG